MIKRKKNKSTKSFVDLGRIFKNAREDIGETIAFISEKIKLPISTLKFIEDNDFDKIDAEIYVRGYISSYAKYLNLNTKDILNIYTDNSNLNKDKEGKKLIKPEPFLKHKITKRHSKFFSLFITSIFFCIFSFAYFKAENAFIESPVKKDSPKIVDNKENQENKPNKLPSPTPAILGGENMTDTERAVINNVLNSEVPAQANNTDDIVLSPFDPDETEQNVASTEETETTTDDKPKKTATLVITFRDNCWIKVKDASGKVIISKVFRKGKKLETKITSPITIKLARPEAIKAIKFAKKDINLKNYKVSKRTYKIK